MSRNSGNQPGGIFSTEYSNKIILLLLGVLILFVFLDFQARRRTAAPVAAQEKPGTALHPVLEPIRDKAEIVLGRSDSSPGNHAVVGNHSVAGNHPGSGSTLLTGPDARTSVSALPTGQPGSGAREVYRNGPVLRPVETNPVAEESFYLYYLRFKGNRLKNAHTELVRVQRPLPEGEVSLMDIIKKLQEGPLSGERGLLNAFDGSIKVTDAYVDQGVAYVYVDKAVGRMGAHIIRDRLDQLTYTLTQFPQVSSVKLLVEGSPVQILGEAQVSLPELLRTGGREVHTYSP